MIINDQRSSQEFSGKKKTWYSHDNPNQTTTKTKHCPSGQFQTGLAAVLQQLSNHVHQNASKKIGWSGLKNRKYMGLWWNMEIKNDKNTKNAWITEFKSII